MITNIEITAKHVVLEPKLKKYITKKIGQLDRFAPRAARPSMHAEVVLRATPRQHRDKYECDVVLRLPHETITIKEATVNMFAAIDIVEARLRNQIKKYKSLHTKRALHKRLLGRLRRSSLAGNVEQQP